MSSTHISNSGQHDTPLVVVVGPTASGKSALAISLADHFSGEIVSCDSVAVYRGMEIGTAKPSHKERARVPHHLIDVLAPNAPCTAGDYSRLARNAIQEIAQRDRLPIVCGGTGLYLRALLDGLFPAPPRQEFLRDKLRQRALLHGSVRLHRILNRLDPTAARLIHTNDIPKIIRAIEVTLAVRQPITQQWEQPRNPLTGFRVLSLGLNPSRPDLYDRINRRAAQMFESPQNGGGLVEETAQIVTRYGEDCRPLSSLGYAQAASLLRGEITREQAIAQARQGHRNYAKRQLTWFRKDPAIRWLPGFGSDEAVTFQACSLVVQHLKSQ